MNLHPFSLEKGSSPLPQEERRTVAFLLQEKNGKFYLTKCEIISTYASSVDNNSYAVNKSYAVHTSNIFFNQPREIRNRNYPLVSFW